MGVTQRCYTAQVRFYPDLPLSTIRYYEVPESNPWFLGENAFYPWKVYKQIENTEGIGEITTLPRPWAPPEDTLHLDGLTFGGNPLGMAGKLPYDPDYHFVCRHIGCGVHVDIPEVLYGTVVGADPGNVLFTVGTVFPLQYFPSYGQWRSGEFPGVTPHFFSNIWLECLAMYDLPFFAYTTLALGSLSVSETEGPFSLTFRDFEYYLDAVHGTHGHLDIFDFVVTP